MRHETTSQTQKLNQNIDKLWTPGPPFTNMFLLLAPSWVNNYINHKVWDEIY